MKTIYFLHRIGLLGFSLTALWFVDLNLQPFGFDIFNLSYYIRFRYILLISLVCHASTILANQLEEAEKKNSNTLDDF
jgi:hypothetical protein